MIFAPNLKLSVSFYKTNIFAVDYTKVSPKKYFAKNLELCDPRNLLFSSSSTVPKLQFGGFYCSFGTVDEVLNNKFLGSQQRSKILAICIIAREDV